MEDPTDKIEEQPTSEASVIGTREARKSGLPGKSLAVALTGIVVLAFALLLSQRVSFFTFGRAAGTPMESMSSMQGIALMAGSVEKFNYLSKQQTNTCDLQANVVLAYADDMRIQGACCSPMDFDHYQAQVEGLKRYADIAQIPSDPNDIPASLAKELLGYQSSIQLTSEQQGIYDQAMTQSNEGGPCCCQCWRWFAYEGMAKYLITQHEWNAQQVADLWDLADGCGGPSDDHA